MSEWMPHGHCVLWDPAVIWARVISDLLVAAAYYSIPVAILAFKRMRPDFHISSVFTMFAIFIAACGTTHVLDAVTIWYPVYWLDAVARMFTAAVSVATAIGLWVMLPTLRRLKVEHDER